MNNTFEDLFQPHILMRGLDYFGSDHVIALEKVNQEYQAIVSGTVDYDVHISLNDYGTITYMSCTCPYAEDGHNCKHMAAVLFAINNDDENEAIQSDNTGDTFEAIVKKIDASDLERFILKELNENDKLAQNFKNYFSQYYNNISSQDYVYEVDSIFYKYLGREGFINYYQASDFGMEFSSYLTSITNLVYSEHKDIVLRVIQYLINRLKTVPMDDSLGTTTEIIDESLELLELLINETDVKDPLYSRIFNYIFKLYDDPDIYIYEERLSTLLGDFFLEETYLLKKLEFFNKKIENLSSSGKKYRSEPYLMKFSLMKGLNYPLKEIIGFLKESSFNKRVQLELAKFYFELNKFEEGLKLFNELKTTGDMNIRESAIRHLVEYYKKIDKKEELVEILTSVITENNSKNYKYYMLLKEQYIEDEWDKMKVEIIEKIQLDEMKYLKILAEEKLFEKMMKYFEKSMYLESLRVYEKTLKNKYPERLLKLYQNKCEEMVEYTNGRSHYQMIANYLKRMKKYPNGVDLVDQLINKWILKYNRRSAMKEEFLKVKSKK